MPLGTAIHNIEITLGKGGQLARAAGAVAKLIAKEGKSATLKLPSGEVRLISKNCSATVGQVGNVGVNQKNLEFIAGQLKNRVSFRKAMKKAIELTEQAGTKGVQVQIAGRIDGKEIARVEWIREVTTNAPDQCNEMCLFIYLSLDSKRSRRIDGAIQVRSNVDPTFSSLVGSGRSGGTTTAPLFSRIHTSLISIWTVISRAQSLRTPPISAMRCVYLSISLLTRKGAGLKKDLRVSKVVPGGSLNAFLFLLIGVISQILAMVKKKGEQAHLESAVQRIVVCCVREG
ncbi:large subunit ribosomal protein L2 [Vigna unguiculata]|uniref:Uncharacterized protein ycf68 n=1 Tax=Vigna unguiculata TaxID=3917 RepID=A0A4D6LLJ5_VIGUN|nr:large subunit ribosomal protein L2 [Vigna unguiculata]